MFCDCLLVSLSGSPRYQDEELRCPAHAAFQRIVLESHRDLQCRSSMVPWLLPQVVLSVLQNARSCAEVARAVLGIKSREDAAALWRPGRQVLPVQCCGLLAVACKADSARCVFCFCHKWLRDICRHCWVLCFLFTQERDGDLRFEREAACGWPR